MNLQKPILRKTIVIVDDSIDLTRLYQDYLTEEGYDVHIARSGQEGLELLRKLPTVDLLIVDCLMPRMTGATFLREVNRQMPLVRRRAHVIGMSGLVHESEDRIEMEPLVDQMVEKAGELDKLLRLVQESISA